MDSDEDSEMQTNEIPPSNPKRSKRDKRVAPSNAVPAKRARKTKDSTRSQSDEEMHDEVYIIRCAECG